MANLVKDKNTVINVTGITLPNGSTNGYVEVSVQGSDPGKILGVKNSSGTYLKHTEAIAVGNNATNVTKINAAITAYAMIYGASVTSVNGVVPESAYNISTSGVAKGQPQNTRNEIPASAFDPNTLLNTFGKNLLPSKVFAMPIDMKYQGNGAQDHIRIRALKYKPPQGGGLSLPKALTGLVSANASLPPPDYEYEGELILPIPSEVRDSSSATWGMKTLPLLSSIGVGAVGPAAERLLQGDLSGIGLAGIDALKGLEDAFKGSSADARSVIDVSLVASLLQNTAGLNVEPSDILARRGGVVANPNMELLFGGPNMRNFTFSWKFVPRSEAEGKRMREIIKFMKLNTLPSLSGSGILINSPNVFFIRYMNGDKRIKALPQPKICACAAFGVDHSEDGQGWSAFYDSQPVATRISMNFLELTPLFRDEMQSAFPAADDVGY